jgi:hypothetical protein
MGARVWVAEVLPFGIEDVGGQSLPVLRFVLMCLGHMYKGHKNPLKSVLPSIAASLMIYHCSREQLCNISELRCESHQGSERYSEFINAAPRKPQSTVVRGSAILIMSLASQPRSCEGCDCRSKASVDGMAGRIAEAEVGYS